MENILLDESKKNIKIVGRKIINYYTLNITFYYVQLFNDRFFMHLLS